MLPLSYVFRSLLARKATAAMTVGGIALTVFVLVTSLTLVSSIRTALQSSAKPDQVVVLQRAAESEFSSFIGRDAVAIVAAAPGVKSGSDGRPIVIGEHVISVVLRKSEDPTLMSNVVVRGVPDGVFALRPEVHVVEGRLPKVGTDEAMLGKGIRGRFEGLDLGQSIELNEKLRVHIVGIFAAAGSGYESEMWCGKEAIQAAFAREYIVSSVTAVLTSPAAFPPFRDAIEHDPRIELSAVSLPRYFENQSEGTASFVRTLGWLVALLFSVGAMIGAAITMYGAVWQRRREIGTLRAIGFRRSAVLISLLLEAALLAVGGCALGILGALALTGTDVTLLNLSSWQETAFAFRPALRDLFEALAFGIAVGVLGGVFPAVRAARMPPIDAIRAG